MSTKFFTNNGLGKIYMAEADTSVPTTTSGIITAVTAASGDYTQIGTVNKDGLTITARSVDSEEKDWNGDTVIQDVHSEWKFKQLDFLDEDAMKAFYGSDNVTTTSGETVTDFDGGLPDPVVLVAVMKDGDKCVCAVLRNGKCTNIADYKFTKGEYTVHDVTFKGEKPSSGKSSFMVTKPASAASTQSE